MKPLYIINIVLIALTVIGCLIAIILLAISASKQKGEVKEEPLPEVPLNRSMLGIANWKKLIVMFAGPFNNIVLSFVLMFIYYGVVRTNQVTVEPGSFIAQSGLQTGEKIEKFEIVFYEYTEEEVNAMKKEQGVDTIPNITGTAYVEQVNIAFGIENLYEESYKFLLQRAQEEYPDVDRYPTVNQRFVFYTDEGKTYSIERSYHFYLNETRDDISVHCIDSLQSLGLTLKSKNTGKEVVKQTFKTEGEMSIAIYQAVGKLFTKGGLSQVSGIVGMYQGAQQFVGWGFLYYVYYIALISLNLGIMNLLPFPALDGGRIVLTIIEMITKKKAPKKVEGILNGLGFAILMGFMVIVTIKDIVGLV